MDKVKQYLELARKHHFWILCALAAVVSLIAWQMSTGKLAAEFTQEKGKIAGVISGLNPNPDQAHDDWSPALAKETKKVAVDVQEAWDLLYNQQKAKICVWPKELGPKFLEATPQLDAATPYLPNDLRGFYLQRVKILAQKLPVIVDAAPLDEKLPVGADGQPIPVEHKVDWPSFVDLYKTFEWDLPPSPLLVKYAQEELWVYEALCNIVKTVNEGSTGKHDAVITEIIDMKIAYAAAEPVFGGGGENRLDPLPVAGSSDPAAVEPPPADAGAERQPPPNPAERGKEEGMRSETPPEGGAPASADSKWKAWRYVKRQPMGEPMMAGDVDASTTKDEYKLMPFRLALKVDGRYLDRLLVACRNADLPLEVQQVRIGPQVTGGSTSVGASSFSFTPRAASGMQRSERDDHGSERGGGGYRPSATVAAPGTVQQHDHKVNVELRGVVYLLNPPRKLETGPGDPTEATPPPDATAVAQPASG